MAAIVWVGVGVVVVLAVLLLVGVVLRRGAARRHEGRLATADGLRGEAAEHTPGVQAAAHRAQQADSDADDARARAERAEQAAAGAHRHLAQEQAALEDVVRRADSADPRVDTAADDYSPITGPDMKGTRPAQ